MLFLIHFPTQLLPNQSSYTANTVLFGLAFIDSYDPACGPRQAPKIVEWKINYKQEKAKYAMEAGSKNYVTDNNKT